MHLSFRNLLRQDFTRQAVAFLRRAVSKGGWKDARERQVDRIRVGGSSYRRRTRRVRSRAAGREEDIENKKPLA